MAIAQVVGAVGTLAAVVVALWIAVRDGRRVRADQADRDARQARLITFEVYEDRDGWRVGTTNQSMAPIFEVTVTKVTCGDHVGEVGPVPEGSKQLAVVKAGERVGGQTIKFDSTDKVIRSYQVTGSYQVTAHFLDAAGLRWRRTGSDPPQRIPSKTTS